MEDFEQYGTKTRTRSLAKDVQFKVIVLGLAAVGKSSLTIRFVLNIFPEEYIPTLQDTHRKTFMVDEKITSLEILDTAGMEEYQTMQDLWIKEGDGFILVYSVADQDSLQDLKRVYDKIQILRKSDNMNPPIYIVGNKIDIDQNEQLVTQQQGENFVQSLNNSDCHHMQVSAKMGMNIDNLFHSIVRQMRIQADIKDNKNNKIKEKEKKKKKKKWYKCNLI